jgi:integrase
VVVLTPDLAAVPSPVRALYSQPRRDFRRAWATACKKAGVPGMLRHDLLRTAVQNMEQAAVPRSMAMKLTGHRTENVCRRCAIVSPADLKAAALKLAGDGASYNLGVTREKLLQTRLASV